MRKRGLEIGIWRGWDLARAGAGAAAQKKVKAGLGGLWFSTWMQEMQRLGQRSELFVTIVGVASSQIESRRGVAGREVRE